MISYLIFDARMIRGRGKNVGFVCQRWAEFCNSAHVAGLSSQFRLHMSGSDGNRRSREGEGDG